MIGVGILELDRNDTTLIGELDFLEDLGERIRLGHREVSALFALRRDPA